MAQAAWQARSRTCTLLRVDLEAFGLCDLQQATTSAGVTVFSGTVVAGDGHDAVRGGSDAAWRAARAAFPQTGLWPVLGWSALEAVADADGFGPGRHGPSRLAGALQLDPAERMDLIIASQRFWWWEGPQELMTEERPDVADYAARFARYLAVTEPRPRKTWDRYRDWQEQGWSTDLLLVPAEGGWEVPALLPGIFWPANWTGDGPLTELCADDHVAVLRYWHDRYGAELYKAGCSSLELEVVRPPSLPAELARCAIEQMCYCYDLTQTLGDMEDAARALAPLHHWTLWWD